MDAVLILTGFTGAFTLLWVYRALVRLLTMTPTLDVRIRPSGGWSEVVIAELRQARREILVIAPLLANPAVAQALADVRVRRRVKVEMLFGYQSERDPRSDLEFLLKQGMAPLVDPEHDPGPFAVIIVDRRTVLAGTWRLDIAEGGPEETLLVIRSHHEVVAQFVQNFLLHKAHTRPAALWSPEEAPRPSVSPNTSENAPEHKPEAPATGRSESPLEAGTNDPKQAQSASERSNDTRPSPLPGASGLYEPSPPRAGATEPVVQARSVVIPPEPPAPKQDVETPPGVPFMARMPGGGTGVLPVQEESTAETAVPPEQTLPEPEPVVEAPRIVFPPVPESRPLPVFPSAAFPSEPPAVMLGPTPKPMRFSPIPPPPPPATPPPIERPAPLPFDPSEFAPILSTNAAPVSVTEEIVIEEVVTEDIIPPVEDTEGWTRIDSAQPPTDTGPNRPLTEHGEDDETDPLDEFLSMNAQQLLASLDEPRESQPTEGDE
jgi:hypothetical protein